MGDVRCPTDFGTIATLILNLVPNDTGILEPVGSPFQGVNNRNNDLGALDPVIIRGETGVAVDVVIDVQSAANSRAWLCDNGESNSVIFKDFRITNGAITGTRGGGILIDNSEPLLQNLIIDHCTCTVAGSAINVDGTTPLGNTVNTTFTDLVIEYNSGSSTVLINHYSLITWNNCIIRYNTSPSNSGGFQVADQSRTTWNNCQIYGNVAATDAGGCRIAGHDTSAAIMNNCLICNNTATAGRGGGFYVDMANTNLYLNNSTIADNTAGDTAGAIYTIYSADAYLDNCIVWGNTAPNPGHSLYENGTGVIDLDYCCYQNGLNDNTGNVTPDVNSFTTNPLFVAGPLGNYYISQIAAGQGADSPCLDTGSNTAVFYGLDTRTTRTDSVTDAGVVDVGWHYEPAAAPVGPAPMLQTITT